MSRCEEPTLRLILLGMLLGMIGSTTTTLASGEPDLAFTRPGQKGISGTVATWLNSCLRCEMVPSVFLKPHNRRTYIYVAYGSKPTGGYGVSVSRITRTDRKALAVYVRFSAPQEGSIVTQQLTRPHDLVMVRDTGWSVTVIPVGKDSSLHVAGLAGIRELRPIVTDSRSIKVFAPRPGATVDNAVTVSGVALVHEGTVQMKLTAGNGEMVAQTFATAASASHWSYFEKTIGIPEGVRADTTLQLELYVIDEDRGGSTDVVSIALRQKRR